MTEFKETNLLYLAVVVLTVILIQFIVKCLFGKKLEKNDDMKTSKDYHMIRRIQHMMTGLGMIVIYELFSEQLTTWGILVGAMLFWTINILRKFIPSLNEAYLRNFGFILRPHEINNMPGAVFFLWGVAFVKCFFPRPIIICSIIILSFGDPCASLFGIYFKSPKITKNKTIAVTFGCGVVSTIIIMIYGYLYLDSFGDIRRTASGLEFGLVTFIISLIAEILPTSRKFFMDDNFSIPVSAAFLFKIWFLFKGI